MNLWNPTLPVSPSSFISDMRGALSDPIFADVFFILHGQKIAAHKLILTVRCPYFQKLLEGSFVESNQVSILFYSEYSIFYRIPLL
jgi:hypothetical protein